VVAGSFINVVDNIIQAILTICSGMFYRSRISRLELDITGKNIAQVYPDASIKGVDLHQSVMKIDFINEINRRDSAAFKVPYPPQWINMIENTLVNKGEMNDAHRH